MKKIVKILDGIILKTGIGIMGLIAILTIFSVAMRYFFNVSFLFLEELVKILFVFTTFFGSAYCIREKAHIEIPYLVDHCGPRMKKVLLILADLLCLWFCIAMISMSMKWIEAVGSTLSVSLNIPCWTYYAFIPISFAISAGYLVLDAFQVLTGKEEG